MTGMYGALVTAEDVRVALTDHLRTWTPAYIAEVGRQRDVTLNGFRGYATTTGDDFPICITAAGSTEGDPEVYGSGDITAVFSAGAAAVVSAPTRDEAQALASYYGAAIRAAVLQHPSLGGFAETTRWTREYIDEVAWDPDHAIVACTEVFAVTVTAVVNVNLGPADPPVDPYVVDTFSQVATVDIIPVRD